MIATSDPIIVPIAILLVVGLASVIMVFSPFFENTTEMDCGTIGCPVPAPAVLAAMIPVVVIAIWLMPGEEKKEGDKV